MIHQKKGGREYNKAYYLANRERLLRARKRRYYADPETARQKSKEWYEGHKERATLRNDAYRTARPEWARRTRQEWRVRNIVHVKQLRKQAYRNTYLPLKQAVYDKLGRKCVRCGITDERVLCIDHVNGGGKQERTTLSPYTLLKKMIADTTGAYQVLCQNCNWIKRHENREWADRRKLAA